MRPFLGLGGGNLAISIDNYPDGVTGGSSMARTWALKRKPVGNHSYFTLRSGWSREAGAPHELWIYCVAVVCVLGAVTLFSVHAGPSAGTALVAIRVAQQELSQAKTALSDPLLDEAESLLALARSTLKERRYEETIVAARKAYAKVVDSSR
jgi:hypothetical protein